MIAPNLSWNGDRAKRLVFDAAWESIRRATEFFHQQVQQELNIPNSGVRVKRKRGRGSYTIYPNPAPKGSPPRKRTGWLQRHAQREYDQAALASRVGLAAGALYGVFLEMADHPWLLATVNKTRAQLEALLRP